MQPEELVRLLTSMAVAADLVEAFDNPELQQRRGWRLTGWSFDLIPWGVRFLYHGRPNAVTAAVVAVALSEAGQAALLPACTAALCPTTILLLG